MKVSINSNITKNEIDTFNLLINVSLDLVLKVCLFVYLLSLIK